MTTGSGLFARLAVVAITRRRDSIARRERDMKTPLLFLQQSSCNRGRDDAKTVIHDRFEQRFNLSPG
jgi:hypothetical protein